MKSQVVNSSASISGYISSLIASLWIAYLQHIKKPILGLSPLQDYILRFHQPSHGNPLITYLYFLTYEKEVWERKCVHELITAGKATEAEKAAYAQDINKTEKQIYEESMNALRNNQNGIENTRIKMIMHMISLIFIVTLMISASAVSTGKLMEMWGESFGPYAYLAQGFFYITAAAAQWMIYRKSVPEVLKKIYFGREGFHFSQHRILKINGEKLENTAKQPEFSKTALIVFSFCSLFLAISLGMIVLDTAGGTVADGNVFKSMKGIHEIAQIFGGVGGFGWFLCIASILCNFALFVSASLKYLFEKANKSSEVKPAWSKKKIGAMIALCVFSTFGLITAVMSQSRSTLDYFWSQISDKSEMPEDSSLGLLLIPILTFIAGSGRFIFNVKAMENLQMLTSELISHRHGLWSELVQDYKNNKWTYVLGSLCVASVFTMFGLMGGFGGGTGIQALHPSASGLGIIPFVATLGGAIVIFSAFKLGTSMMEPNNNAEVASNISSYSSTPSSAVKNTFTLQRDSERRSGLQLLMIAGNVVGAGAISASSVATLLLYGNEGNKDLKLALIVLSMFAGGLMSMASALSRVNVQVTEPATSSAQRQKI